MNALSRDEVLRRFASMKQAPRPDGGRAPHKPLLALYLLGRIQQERGGGPLVVPYANAEPVVSGLITEFGPSAREIHRAALPFFHLDAPRAPTFERGTLTLPPMTPNQARD